MILNTFRQRNLTLRTLKGLTSIWILSSLNCSIFVEKEQRFLLKLRQDTEQLSETNRSGASKIAATSKVSPLMSPLQIHEQNTKLSRRLYPLELTGSAVDLISSTSIETSIKSPQSFGPTDTVGSTLNLNPDN